MKQTTKNRWRNAKELLCPHLHWEENPVAYKEGELSGNWLTLILNPCRNCEVRSCANHKKFFDEPEKLILLGKAEELEK